ncbi:MAG: GH39 family glycosyl hydrolase [bacterium]
MTGAKLAYLLAIFLGCLPFAHALQPDRVSSGSDKAPAITRTIDASQYFRPFPRLPDGRNTSIQKAPAPVLAEVSEREFGRPRVTKCWLNLDEMWDYRPREYDFNYRIGVSKYDDVKEKHRETWGSVKETNVHFREYLLAFGKHSDEVMLTIRRYERDILDGKLGVTMADWKEIFKQAVIHYRRICPNLRYIEVCNEYALKGFIGCTAEEYYRFYEAGYQAVNEANEELGLQGEARVLVGGPAVTGDIIGKMDRFFENFSKDESPDRRLDFVSWHEYGKSYHGTALREGQVQGMLASHAIPKKPMFVTEHDPVHGKLGTHELNLVNGAGLVKSLYFSNVYSPGMTIMPWVQYHISEIQTQFMWFDGPNEPDTRAEELRLLPSGCSMKLLSMHKEWEVAVDNGLERDELVLASVQNDGLAVHVVNYGETRDVRIQVDKLPQVFEALDKGRLRFVKYQIDEAHSNGVADPSYSGGPRKVGEGTLTSVSGSVTLTHAQLMKNGILMWRLIPENVGAVLNQPVSDPALPTGAATDLPVLDFDTALGSARAEAEARIERDGTRFRVAVAKSHARPGIAFASPAGGWSVAGLEALQATVRNTSNHTLNVHLAIDGPGADRTHRRNCKITSETIPPGQEKTLVVPIVPAPPDPVAWLRDGHGKTFVYPESWEKEGYNLDKARAVSVYVYQPRQEYTYEVFGLRAIPAPSGLPQDR